MLKKLPEKSIPSLPRTVSYRTVKALERKEAFLRRGGFLSFVQHRKEHLERWGRFRTINSEPSCKMKARY